MGKRSAKTQKSLFREKDEAHQLLRAVEQLRDVRATVVLYKNKNFGTKIKDACLSDILPEPEAKELADHMNRAIDDFAITLAHRASEIVNKIILSIRDDGDPESIKEPVMADPNEIGTEDQI